MLFEHGSLVIVTLPLRKLQGQEVELLQHLFSFSAHDVTLSPNYFEGAVSIDGRCVKL